MDNQERRRRAVDYVNSAISSYQNLRNLSGLVRGAGLAGRAALAAASGPGGAILIGLAVLLIPVFLILLGGQAIGTEIPKKTLPGSPALLICTTIDQSPGACLKKDFNIEASGFDGAELKDIYKAFSLVYSYPLYKNIWDKGGRKLLITNEPPFHAETVATCTAEAILGKGADDKIKFRNPIERKCTFYGGLAYLIIHEAGHILSDRDDPLFKKFELDSGELIRSDGQACYKSYNPPQGEGGGGHYLKTYIGPGTFLNDENFAEGTAVYVLHKTWAPALGGKVYSLEDFPNQCPKTYEWFRDNVFGQ